MSDKYQDMRELKAAKKRNNDYKIFARIIQRYPIAVLAPHGGKIESGTSRLARLIAGSDYRLYLFEGVMHKDNFSELHVKSNRFNECRALAVVRKSETALAIHGRNDKGDPKTIWAGGLHTSLRDKIAANLRNARFNVTVDPPCLKGECAMNICNRTRSGVGVQLELPNTLRLDLMNNSSLRKSFVTSIRDALDSYRDSQK